MLMRSLVRTRPVSNSTRPIAFGAIANRTRSSTPPSLFHYRAPLPSVPLVLARPSPYLHRAVAAAFLLSNGEAAPRTSTCLASPRVASRRVGSPQLDSTRLASSRLDPTRLASFRSVPSHPPRLSFCLASPRLCSLVLADPEDCNSRSFSSDSHRFSDESRMISRLSRH